MLKVMSYNVLGFKGFSAQASDQSMTEKQIFDTHLEQLDLLQPDVVIFQEAPHQQVIQHLASALDWNYRYFISQTGWSGSLLTKFQIRSSETYRFKKHQELFSRFWSRTVLLTNKGEDLVIHAAHLHDENSGLRKEELHRLAESVTKDVGHYDNLLLIGDLNHRPELEDYQILSATDLRDLFLSDKNNADKYGHTFLSTLPMARLDYMWGSKSMAEKITKFEVLSNRPFGDTTESGDYAVLSDHLPVMAHFEETI